MLSLLYKGAQREGLWALFAFHHEVAKTRDVVTETVTGQIRLQWWRDAVEKIYADEVLEHEVVKALAECIERFGLNKDDVLAIIDGRVFDLSDEQPETWSDFEAYILGTVGAVNKTALQILDEEEAADVVRDVCLQYGAARILCAVPYHLKRRRCLLPKEIMEAHDVRLTQLYDWGNVETMRPVVKDVLGRVLGDVQPKHKMLCANKKMAQLHLKQIVKCDCNVFDGRMMIDPPFKALRVWLNL